jgi:hypothetical protein
VHQFEQAEIAGGILLGALKLLEELHPAGSLAEEAHKHAVLRPDLSIVGRQILHDVVGGCGKRRSAASR